MKNYRIETDMCESCEHVHYDAFATRWTCEHPEYEDDLDTNRTVVPCGTCDFWEEASL